MAERARSPRGGRGVGWALWQGLRGPVARRPPATDRSVLRLRVAFYAAAGSWLVYTVAPAWPWWAVVIDSLVMSAVVVLFHPVLRRAVGFPGLALAAGLLTNTSVAAVEVFDVLGWREARRVADMPDISGLAGLIWTALVFLTRPVRPAGPAARAGVRVMVRYADIRPRLGDSEPSYGPPNLR